MEKVTQSEIDEFNKELTALCTKHNFNLGSEALIVDGKIISKVVIVPVKKNEEKSAK